MEPQDTNVTPPTTPPVVPPTDANPAGTFKPNVGDAVKVTASGAVGTVTFSQMLEDGSKKVVFTVKLENGESRHFAVDELEPVA